MATSFFNIHSAGPVQPGSPAKGERLGRVQAESAREALDVFSIGEGFVSYADAEMEENVTEWPDGSASAPFTNFEIIAVPSFVNEEAIAAQPAPECRCNARGNEPHPMGSPGCAYFEPLPEPVASRKAPPRWQNEHRSDCPVTEGRASLSKALARDPGDAALLGAVPEWDKGGDEEGEHCNCGMLPRACRFCGGEVQSTNPETDFCRNCFYTGRWAEEQHAALLSAFKSIAGVKSTAVWHTGGGCFNLAVTFADGRLATPSVSFQEQDGSWGIEPGFPSDPGDRWGVVVSESEEAWSEWDEERLAMPQEALGLTEVELVGYVAKLAAQPGVLEPAPGKARTILAHLNIQVPASDPRTADHIAADIESALRVGLEGAPADVMVERYFWTLVEEVS